jgi:hypothetical protein
MPKRQKAPRHGSRRQACPLVLVARGQSAHRAIALERLACHQLG